MYFNTYTTEVLNNEQPSGNICSFAFKVDVLKNLYYVTTIVKSCIMVAKGVCSIVSDTIQLGCTIGLVNQVLPLRGPNRGLLPSSYLDVEHSLSSARFFLTALLEVSTRMYHHHISVF